LGAGGAIVLDSDPVAEYAEMVLKAGDVATRQPGTGAGGTALTGIGAVPVTLRP